MGSADTPVILPVRNKRITHQETLSTPAVPMVGPMMRFQPLWNSLPCPPYPNRESPEDLLATLNRDKLKFDALSWEIIRQMVEERVQLRDKHRKDIMGRITDVSGDISRCYTLKTPDSLRSRAALEKTQFDLEKQAREEDISLWKDLTDLRKELLINQRQYRATRMRQDLVNSISSYDGDKEETHPMGTGYMPGA